MKRNEYLIEGMRTFLDDEPEAFAAYEAYMRLSDNPVLWEKIKSRERFLEEQMLLRAGAYHEGRKEGMRAAAIEMREKGLDNVLISEATGLSLSEIEELN